MATAVVTGVSTGIGLGIARVLLARGWTVFGSVRREADAERLREEGGERFRPLLFDITDEVAVRRAAAQVREALDGENLRGLVNNAGVAFPAPLLHQELADFRRQLDVNLVGAFLVTREFAPLLGAEAGRRGPPGRVVNISSVSGKLAAPFVGAYVASKHGLEGLSDSFRLELLPYGVDVVVVGPGTVATPIWDKAEALDVTPYARTLYAEPLRRFRELILEEGRRGLPPERIGEVVFRALTLRRPKSRYAVVRGKLANWTLPRLVPKRFIARVVAWRLGFSRPPTGPRG